MNDGTEPTNETSVAAGTRLDRRLGSRYELLRPLGRGAMGEVWLGRDNTDGTVAIKMLRPELSEDPQLWRGSCRSARS